MTPAPYTTLQATPATPWRADTVIQGSEFIALAVSVDTPEDALAWLKTLRAARPDATHVCWAYVVGPAYRFSDDGEPGGTAGQPILRALQGQGLDHVVAAVIRYYGGSKLGTGGLVRAYGGVAAECLSAAPRRTVRPRVSITVQLPFGAVSALYQLLAGLDTVRGEEVYGPDGLSLPLALYPEDLTAFTRALRDATRGAAEVRPWPEESAAAGES